MFPVTSAPPQRNNNGQISNVAMDDVGLVIMLPEIATRPAARVVAARNKTDSSVHLRLTYPPLSTPFIFRFPRQAFTPLCEKINSLAALSDQARAY